MDRLNKEIKQFIVSSLTRTQIDAGELKNFQELVFNSESISDSEEIEELIRELAYDLDYYEEDEEKRLEDSSFFGIGKALKLIKETYEKLSGLESKI